MALSGTMKTIPIARPILALLIACLPLRAEDEIEKAFRDALYAEEVKGDTEAALKAYADVSAKFELQRDMAATALYRQAECLRKLGRKDEAAALYKKVLAQYADKERTAKLSRENLAALGQPAPDMPAAAAAPAGLTEEEAKELTRLKALAANSPDLLDQRGPLTGNPPGNSVPPPLDAAAAKGQATVVEWLLKNLPATTPDRLSDPLESACRNGHLKVCELLLKAGADPNKGGPLVAAIEAQRLAVARLLLAHTADPNQKGAVKTSNISWPLEGAGFKGPVSLQQRRFGEATPLFAAINAKLTADFISELIKAGADVDAAVQVSDDAQENRGSAAARSYPVTPLGAAILQSDVEKVGLLLSAKAGVNKICNDLGATPPLIALAVREASREGVAGAETAADSVIGQLTAAGADWKARLSTGATALHIAARRGLGRWVEEALKAGLDVNAPDNSGYTPLHLAAKGGSLECVQKLLAAGAKVDAVTTDDWKITPLGLACLYAERKDASLEILKALLDAKADPNVLHGYGFSLFDVVMSSGNPDGRWPEAAILLSERGARVPLARQPDFFKTSAFQLKATTNTPRPVNGQANPVSEERILAAFRVLWKATYWRDNPRLPHAVWLDDGETPLREGGKAVFSPQFVDDSALSAPPSLRVFFSRAWGALDGLPNTWRDFTRVTVRRMKDGKEEAITVDLLALATKANAAVPAEQKIEPAGATPPGEAKDFPLQWGDVVSIPKTANPDPAASQLVQKWCCEAATIKVRLALAGGGVVTNAAAGGEPLWISTVPYTGECPFTTVPALLREAGIPAGIFNLTIKQKHMSEAGVMETLDAPGQVFHGDILTVEAPQPQAKLSKDAMRSGIWLCQSMEGPFYPVATQQYADNTPAPLGGLLLALMAPHPLPFTNVDWEKAKVVVDRKSISTLDAGYTALGEGFGEKLLLDAWPELGIVPGIVLVLPPAEKPLTPPPAALIEDLKPKLSFDWQLALGTQPELNRRWEPRFFQRTGDDKTTSWQDMDPEAAGRPLLPVAADLLAVHPRAGEFWPPVGNDIARLGEKGKITSFNVSPGSNDWLLRDGFVHAPFRPQVPPPQPRGGTAVSPSGQSSRRVYPLAPGQTPPNGAAVLPQPAIPAPAR